MRLTGIPIFLNLKFTVTIELSYIQMLRTVTDLRKMEKKI